MSGPVMQERSTLRHSFDTEFCVTNGVPREVNTLVRRSKGCELICAITITEEAVIWSLDSSALALGQSETKYRRCNYRGRGPKNSDVHKCEN